jgi:hypothetical protein
MLHATTIIRGLGIWHFICRGVNVKAGAGSSCMVQKDKHTCGKKNQRHMTFEADGSGHIIRERACYLNFNC